MLAIEQVDLSSRKQVDAFIDFQFQLYGNTPQWVPPLKSDMRTVMNKQKHPFYEHSDADFFVARQDGKVVGRIAALENRAYNRYHEKQDATFYYFDSIDDQQVVNALFNRVAEWARARGLNRLVGPKGFGAFDGYGIQIEGFSHRQMMTMMNYNFPYYEKLVEAWGFTKEVDFVSSYMDPKTIRLPDPMHEIVRRVSERGSFQVRNFTSKSELREYGMKIGKAYNQAFVQNWEYYPLTDRELKLMIDNLLTIADPKLIKAIMHGDDVAGFVLGFVDVSVALQKMNGRITPAGVVSLMQQMKRSRWLDFNGAGVLPQYQGRGAIYVLYNELERTIRENVERFDDAELTQVADTATRMRQELESLGVKPYKNHRVYQKML